MKIVIMHQTITNHDAIGNDIEAMYQIFSKTFECSCYAQNQFNTAVTYIDEEELRQYLSDSENLVIYHHSVYWEQGEKILESCKCKILFRYHNITPPSFFENYNEHHFLQCDRGRKQTLRFQEKYKDAFWLSASVYNTLDLNNVSQPKIGICPPFHKIESWGKSAPDEAILQDLLTNKTLNLLFVGRVAPNKGHLFLIDALYKYCINWGSNIKLRIIGKFDDSLLKYNQEIQECIRGYGLNNNVEFIGEITDATLISYYLGSDIFVCASEHEGFCVPIVEAQYFQLPIIALSSTAVTETLGSNQILMHRDTKKFASAISVIEKNLEYRDFLRKNGKRNFDTRFTFHNIEKNLKTIFNERMEIKL